MLSLRRDDFNSLRDALAEIDRVGSRDHFVQFYGADETLVKCVARFFAVGFAQGNVAVIVATKEHRDAVDARLAEIGIDVQGLRESGDYASFDAREMLSSFMVGKLPDKRRFRALLGSWMEVAARSGTGIRAFGEMVALLCAEGNVAGAIELEHLWNELGETHEFLLYCAYPAAQFACEGGTNSLADVCRAHSKVIG